MAMTVWLTSSVVRNFPSTPPRRNALRSMAVARNERFSFQVAMRGDARVKVAVAVRGPRGWTIRVRRVGYVPVEHHNLPIDVPDADIDGRDAIPGYVPDPLFDETAILLPPEETHAFWVTVTPSPESPPGRRSMAVTATPENGAPRTVTLAVTQHGVLIEPRRDFDVTNWFYVDALMDWYRTDMFDRRFWEIVARYMRNVVEHGQNTLYVPVFTPPLDGVKRPSQLLRVRHTGTDRYTFDWTDVRRYVRLARAQGVTRFEWCHPFTQWGVHHAIRVYEGQGREEKLLWPPDTGATSAVYRAFLARYLPALQRFLKQEDLLDCSFFHVSDEPHGETALKNYKAARALLADLAPWMKVMDALTDLSYAREGLTDMPVPSIGGALNFVREGIPCWCYYCCGPRGRYLNRLLDTPLPKIAMHGFLLYRWPVKGFLHWGYNYWYRSQTRELIDPYTVQDGAHWSHNWAYGDPFVVYPGAEGPVDSIRWEVFGESLQDYALLQTLGVERDDPCLASLRGFDTFPKSAEWRRKTRQQLLAGARRFNEMVVQYEVLNG